MEQIISGLKELKLSGMVSCLESNDFIKQSLTLEECLEFLVHYELTAKKNKKIERLLSNSSLKTKVKIEDIHANDERGLTRSMLLNLMRLEFLSQHKNLIITGATGCGKTHLASAIGVKACMEGYSVKLVKLPMFLEEIHLHHQTGTFTKLLHKLINYDLLILDDFGLTNIDDTQLHDLFNIIDERYKLKSIIITSQLPTQTWHNYLKNPTLADAILDRLLSQSDKLELTGESLRWDKKEKSHQK
jgi:DNA replication protein DnaC